MNTKLDQNLVSELAQMQNRFSVVYWSTRLISVGPDGVHVHDVRELEGVTEEEIKIEHLETEPMFYRVVNLCGARFYSLHNDTEAQS